MDYEAQTVLFLTLFILSFCAGVQFERSNKNSKPLKHETNKLFKRPKSNKNNIKLV